MSTDDGDDFMFTIEGTNEAMEVEIFGAEMRINMEGVATEAQHGLTNFSSFEL